jgi:hypothetical protein
MNTATLESAIHNCWEARNTCQTTLVDHCLAMGGAHVEKKHVKLMLDCIQACQTSADFMSRGSALHAQMCGACAAVCEACATSCAAIGTPEMKACADACRKCAASCKAMSGMKAAA